MTRHVWTVACTHAVIDQESNLISLLDVIEQLNITGKPAPNKVVGLTLDLTTLWVRENPETPEKGRARITLVSPSGAELKSMIIDVDLSAYERLRSRGRFVGIPAPEDGRYTFRVDSAPENSEAWIQVALIPLQIAFAEEQHEEDKITPDN